MRDMHEGGSYEVHKEEPYVYLSPLQNFKFHYFTSTLHKYRVCFGSL